MPVNSTAALDRLTANFFEQRKQINLGVAEGATEHASDDLNDVLRKLFRRRGV
ncbi:hypothetical protein EV216_101206 [Rhodovulum steppense]|uniref:Uncharacterized protein n=1 Tax=Rhodovulum steppense TaxID=540251 RepID=A0A4R1Z3H6_9RHOB|nr:hypothetical protein EV216_101206 [Rhodovulum steppense]